jgi:putative transposase
MKRIPRPVLRALEALAQSPINTSALAMAEGQDFAHDTLYRALNQPLASFFELSLELCKAMGGLDRGYLILDDVLIQRYRSGKLGLKKARDTSTGAWVFGLSLVVLAWTDGKRRIPLAFLPYFGEEESKLDLALALLEWAKEAGFRPEGVLFDAWYAARQVLEWLHAHGWPFVTRLRSNRVLDGVQLRRHGGTRWVKAGRLRGLTFAVGVLKRGGKFYGTDREKWWGVGMREIYRLRPPVEQGVPPDGLGVLGKDAAPLGHHLHHLLQVVKVPVRHRLVHQGPHPLHGLELGRVGGQEDQAHPLRHLHPPRDVPPSPVQDHPRLLPLPQPGPELPQNPAHHLRVHPVHQKAQALPRLRFHKGAHVEPPVPVRPHGQGPLPPPGPHPPVHRPEP